MPRAVVLVASALAATAAIVGAGVLALGGTDDRTATGDPTGSSGPAPYATTPLSDFDATGLVVAREAFCDDIDDRQVSAALGADAVAEVDGVAVLPRGGVDGVEDVAHEFGCRYAATDGTVAQAWVFAPPVDATSAQRLVKTAGKAASCQVGAGPAFGAPTLAMTCPAKGGVTRASYRGLFGDAWLVCEVDRPAGADWDVVDRAGRWCVGVLEAARA